jgi:hypothetical protein
MVRALHERMIVSGLLMMDPQSLVVYEYLIYYICMVFNYARFLKSILLNRLNDLINNLSTFLL